MRHSHSIFGTSILFLFGSFLCLAFLGCSSDVSVQADNIFDRASEEITPAELSELRSNFDSDSDGLADHEDPCPDTDLNDADGDGICEVILSDLNDDGCVDLLDQSILIEELGKRGHDLRSDLVPDKVINLADVATFAMENGQCQDNCPSTANPAQEDANMDGVGDACTNILATCGNGTLDEVESCEGTNLGGQTCRGLGFDSGTLSCTDQCHFDTTKCSATFVVSNVNGSFVNGNALTVTGSGFGSKAQGAPVVFDTMESGSFKERWTRTPERVVEESRHRHSRYAAHHNFESVYTGGDGDYGYFTGPNDTLGERWYVQYWFKMDTNFDWGSGTYNSGDGNLANVKIFRMWNPGSIDENFVMATQGYGGGSVVYGSEYISDGNGAGYCCRFEEWPKAVWNLFQFEYKESDVGSFNGEIRVWMNGNLMLDDRGIITREDFSQLKRPFIVGFYDSWNDSQGDRDDWFMDDAYIDNTFARIEVGNAPAYEECTHREIQPATSWNANAIEIEANPGGLVQGSSAYLFVVDHDGNVSPGFGPINVE